MRMWTLELDVDDFDPEEYYELRKKLIEKGIELTTLAEIGIDENTSRKLHEVYEEAMHDVPMSDEYTGTDHDRFIEFFEHPDFFPETYIIAVKDDEFIGLSSHWKKEDQDVLYTQLTGIREDSRGKGLATAMKVKAIKIASEKGIPKIRTDNETGNEAMLHINQKWGFKKKPAWISYEKFWENENS